MDKRCGECRFFRVGETRGTQTHGTCRLGKVMGVFSDEMRACPAFTRQGEVAKVVDTSRRSPSRRRSAPTESFRVRPVSAAALHAAVGEWGPEALKTALLEWAEQLAGISALSIGQGWRDGVVALCPANPDLKNKEVPLDQLFNKLLMIREQLRVMEQKLNGCDALQRAERLDLHRKLAAVRAAVSAVANGWLAPTPPGLLAPLWTEAQTSNLALPFPDLGAKWIGGQAVFTSDAEQITEPIEQFFVRVVCLRDRLAVLEAELEAHAAIPRGEGAAMTAHLRRCHGSLTTFNALFADRADYFSSSR